MTPDVAQSTPRNMLDDLVRIIDSYKTVNVAVSGGVDSMLLSYIAHRFSSASIVAVHAVSPAVPQKAYQRIRDYVARLNWHYHEVDAQELSDPNYRNNPINRCYYCKKNLYTRIQENFEGTIASGTNLDDLSDYRPGLEAGREHRVVHPYVEAGIDKTMIYALAAYFDLDDLAALPAQPCLASRIETEIPVTHLDLSFVDIVEEFCKARLGANQVLRCRLTSAGVVLELGQSPDSDRDKSLVHALNNLCRKHNKVFVGIRPYRRGSAFVHGIGND